MSSCEGNGECLKQCMCFCYDEETEEYYENCTCGHREHNGYCPSTCCMPVECRNYKYCNERLPKWALYCHNGMCINCVIQMGKHKFTNQLEDCCVCLENKPMLILKCDHKVCNDCWCNITQNKFDTDDNNPKCPLCRNINTWK
jgi:hypothetical protein